MFLIIKRAKTKHSHIVETRGAPSNTHIYCLKSKKTKKKINKNISYNKHLSVFFIFPLWENEGIFHRNKLILNFAQLCTLDVRDYITIMISMLHPLTAAGILAFPLISISN